MDSDLEAFSITQKSLHFYMGWLRRMQFTEFLNLTFRQSQDRDMLLYLQVVFAKAFGSFRGGYFFLTFFCNVINSYI
jgi:hypothetical protein